MDRDEHFSEALRDHVLGRAAHIPLSTALEGVSWEQSGESVAQVPHTIWSLVWHIRAAMADIVSYVDAPEYHELDYPSGYWPERLHPASDEAWVNQRRSVDELLRIIGSWIDERDLYAPLPRGSGHTLAREILIVGQHNSYHIAQIVEHRMLIGMPLRDW